MKITLVTGINLSCLREVSRGTQHRHSVGVVMEIGSPFRATLQILSDEALDVVGKPLRARDLTELLKVVVAPSLVYVLTFWHEAKLGGMKTKSREM